MMISRLAAGCTFIMLEGASVCCADDCTCKWTVLSPEGTRWSGITGEIAMVTAETVKECQDACCDGKKAPAGCVAFRYESSTPPACHKLSTRLCGAKHDDGCSLRWRRSMASGECTMYSETPTATVWGGGAHRRPNA